jgi:hypothetical protein
LSVIEALPRITVLIKCSISVGQQDLVSRPF